MKRSKLLSALFFTIAVIAICLCGVYSPAFAGSYPADIVVAASNSSPACKAQANLVCDGQHDEVELLQSINKAGKTGTGPFGRYLVIWLPGDYYLDATLVIPDSTDAAIDATGTFFHYKPATGDAVVVTGLSRCRFNFGTIECGTTGAALRIRPNAGMPSLMSIVKFTGLLGKSNTGIGLVLDSTLQNVCTNKFEGTDIYGFDTGVYLPDVGSPAPPVRPTAKTDTNWFWISYIRGCNTCIWVKHNGIDSNIWNVNVDASLPNSTAIRSAEVYGRSLIIMGVAGGSGTKGIILDPGATDNTFEVPQRPSGIGWTWINNSGNSTNKLITPS